jgi:hypothetical protein
MPKKEVLISGEAVLLYDSTCIVTTYRLELGSELNSRHVHASTEFHGWGRGAWVMLRVSGRLSSQAISAIFNLCLFDTRY